MLPKANDNDNQKVHQDEAAECVVWRKENAGATRLGGLPEWGEALGAPYCSHLPGPEKKSRDQIILSCEMELLQRFYL